ncbi:hypothetical protein [Streptomyces aureocirculatus]|uniref:hypothetical protein n=1 Tax=Streptomyces aureocirculatus TaxID=67275 RepID=UPI000A68CC9D|nr:hypothetical protein [Streptomyces aureocirculatus]
MYKTGSRALVAGLRALAAGAAAVAVLLAGSGQSLGRDAAERDGTDREAAGGHTHELRHSDIPWSGSPSPFESQVRLADGRRVAMHHLRDKRLYVQDYSPEERGWSKPAVVHRAKSEACQGITLRARATTVAAIADFGTYCADGEPPTESVAAVATGSLTQWNRHLTKDFDGWEKALVSPSGKQVTFKRGGDTLKWTKSGGFSRDQA